MIPSSADPNPTPGVSDATVEMERPTELVPPPHSSTQGAPTGAVVEMEPAALAHAADAKRKPSRFAFDEHGPDHRTPLPNVRPSSAPTPAATTVNDDNGRPADLAKSPLPAARLDATVEMARPAELTKLPVPANRLDATVEMARPDVSKDSTKEQGRSVEMVPPVLANLEATVEIALPSGTPNSPRPLPAAELNETEAIDLSAAGVQRRVAERKSDVLKRNTPTPASVAHPRKLGEILVQMGKLSPEQVDEAVQLAQEQGERIGNFLLRWELVQPETLCRALSIQTGLPMTMLDGDAMPEHLSKLFPLPLMMHHHFVPFDESGAVLCLAAGSPLDPEMIREQEQVLRKVIEVFIAREDQVARQLDWLRTKLKTRSRRSPRFNLRLTVSFQFCNRLGARSDKGIHAATTVNISEGGYLLECVPISEDPSEMLLKGMYVNACIKSMTGDIWAICDVREIRLIDTGREPKWLLGVEILDINPENKKRLKALCKRPAKPAQ